MTSQAPRILMLVDHFQMLAHMLMMLLKYQQWNAVSLDLTRYYWLNFMAPFSFGNVIYYYDVIIIY